MKYLDFISLLLIAESQSKKNAFLINFLSCWNDHKKSFEILNEGEQMRINRD